MPSGFHNTPSPLQIGADAIEANLGGIISSRQSAKYMSGARTVLRINGNIVGFAFGISWRIETSYGEIDSIDNPLTDELVPAKIKVDGSISALHIPGQSATSQLWQADVLSFLFHQYITIEVRDSVTQQLLFFAPKAVITSRSEDLRVDELSQVTLQFKAIGFQDEKTPETPNGFDTLEKKQSTGDSPTEVVGGLISKIGSALGL